MRIPTIILLTTAVASVADAQTDWPIYGHDPGGRQYSPLKEIDTRNVSKLKVAWTYDTRPAVVPLPAGTPQPAAEGAPTRPAPPRNRASQATPLVIDGMLYLSSPYNRTVALEPSPDFYGADRKGSNLYGSSLVALDAATGQLRVIFPGWVGGVNWSPTALNPDLGYLYVTSHDLGNINTMVPNATGTSVNGVGPAQAPANLGGRFWGGAKRGPCQTPPWGEILAVNVNTGDIAWREPLGSFEELDALGVPKTRTPEPRGGPIATAGGVLFIGAAIDRRFRALDAKTGKELWVASLAESAKATPIAYQGKNGKQYVAVVAAAGDGRGADNPGGRLYVFTLP